ncbi:uncharacterized protein Z520_08054 [Fonsecaea multimorphosa CBS 102226]|uniref:Uncharacterized protein n=1 Tax=Fonsecaea multimorphosa CBS 102226 TaxID=1442371 RepID=A0A0D2IGU3_9EURO|nr:uncharacterized protein Z520_08054 [Fonsecaea multimorphosa CBS 102226]KIX96276.1 hypothetical protein Z520_08054 [Fonsecaea multimorphosa CBS 102226]OAL21938.1 hypothetical protein AYO22_07535 [Fonsecaea multimorphosa]
MPAKYLSKLQGKSVLLVGGTSGIGYGIAEGCLEFGAKVVIASRSADKVASAVESLKASYPEHAANIRGHTVNLNPGETDVEKQLVALFDFATDNGATKLDHVVETAGDLSLAGQMGLDTITPELLAKAGSVRLVGVIMLAKVASRYLNKASTSTFTMTSGVLLYRPRPGLSPFIGAGGNKEAFARGLAIDLAPVRVNVVAPGAIETELLYSSVPQGMKREDVMELYKKHSLLGKVGTVEDVAECYLSLMKNGFQTGTVVQCEGGYLLI